MKTDVITPLYTRNTTGKAVAAPDRKQLYALFSELRQRKEAACSFLEQQEGLAPTEKMILLFLNCLRSDSTQGVYLHYICNFFVYSGKSFDAVAPEDLERYVLFLHRDQQAAKATVNTALGGIRSFYRWLHECGFVKENPAKMLNIPDVDSPDKVVSIMEKSLSFDEVSRVIQHLRKAALENTKTGKRDLALLYVLARAGLYVSEACRLKWKDFCMLQGGWALTITGNNGKRRLVVLPTEGIGYLLDLREALFGIPGNVAVHGEDVDALPLFARVKGDPSRHMTRNNVNRIINKLCQEISGIKKFSPHGLRHTCLTHLSQLNAPLESIKDFAGHGAMSTTRMYLDAGSRITESALIFNSTDTP